MTSYPPGCLRQVFAGPATDVTDNDVTAGTEADGISILTAVVAFTAKNNVIYTGLHPSVVQT